MAEYLLSRQGLPDIERERLLLLEEMYDPWSVKQLDAIGVERVGVVWMWGREGARLPGCSPTA